jgi:hypothetical protein
MTPFEGRLPSPAEAIGAAMQLAGVCAAVAAFNKPRALSDLSQKFEFCERLLRQKFS